MAPAKLSRRKGVHRNDMSDIEDMSSQNRAQDEVESDGADHPTTHRVKKGKGKRRAQEEVNNEHDSDSDAPIDVENFPDQPLNREQMSKLLGMADDWEKLAAVIKRPLEMFGASAGGLADLDDEEAQEVRMLFLSFHLQSPSNVVVQKVDEIDGYMRESLDIISVMKAHADTLTDIRQKGLQGEETVCLYL